MDWPGASRLCLSLPPQLWEGRCTLVPTSSSWCELWGWNSGAQLCSAILSPMAPPLAPVFSIETLCRASQLFLRPFRVRVGWCLPASLKKKKSCSSLRDIVPFSPLSVTKREKGKSLSLWPPGLRGTDSFLDWLCDCRHEKHGGKEKERAESKRKSKKWNVYIEIFK